MADTVLRDLDFSACGRLFSSLVGDGHALAVCDREGGPLWAGDPPGSERLEAALKRFGQERGFAASEGNIGRLELGSEGTLLVHPIASEGEAALGWLAALAEEPDLAEERAGRLREALGQLASGLERECQLNMELDGMAGELAERYEELNLVYGLSGIAKDYGQGEELFKPLLKLCTQFLRVDLAVFLRSEKELTFHAGDPKRPLSDIDLVLARLQGEVYHFVASGRETAIINRPDDPKRAYLYSDSSHKILATPILVKQKVQAILVLIRADDRPDFSNSDRNLVEVLADQAGILIRDMDIFQEMKLFTEQMVLALIEAVDAKDPYTRGHSERVNLYAMEIGREIGLAGEDLQILYWSSLLHDLGKVGIPDRVLSKPQELDRDENFLIRGHAERGFEILNHVMRLHYALPGIRYHHERFDGSGYPYGLKGKAIPLQARIIAVADTYDAMTSSRAYRPARSHEEAMAEMERVSGSQLDMDIVAVWFELVRSRPEIISTLNPVDKVAQ
ncbi:MAG: hypothetical protein C0617_11875 [Desulfuromonas sp.]|uniref:HD-GYP domain-containing protein n=1 Tax=Desulfuromonas sp. TaxID=892 RepID=UPI000CB66B7B|nr:HD domain-containing phosphohydrolase [Desulfuromonas sp.]PLX83228.1 MAG: hypothetical protein C0617_11875 [Desulfuromonas sp.]